MLHLCSNACMLELSSSLHRGMPMHVDVQYESEARTYYISVKMRWTSPMLLFFLLFFLFLGRWSLLGKCSSVLIPHFSLAFNCVFICLCRHQIQCDTPLEKFAFCLLKSLVCSCRCNFMNFSKNKRCQKCGEQSAKKDGDNNIEAKKGDWICSE